MRVIGLNGSPRKKAAPHFYSNLLKTARQEGAEAELIHLQPLLQEQNIRIAGPVHLPVPEPAIVERPSNRLSRSWHRPMP